MAILVAGAGQITLKLGMTAVGRIGTGTDVGDTARRIVTSPLVMLGLCLYGLGAIIWLVVLSRVSLSLAYPLLGLTYVVVTIAAYALLGENVSLLRWLGVLLVSIGVAVIAQG